MNYFIVFLAEDGWEWCALYTKNLNYAKKVYDDITPPPEYYKELRQTEEPLDTYISFDVIDSTY